jgi:spore germination cell wall hydrolase CwlJ-like protein
MVRLTGSHTYKEKNMIALHNHERRFNYSSWTIKILSLICVLFVVTTITTRKLDFLIADKEATQYGVVSTQDRLSQLDCLSRNIYYEAAHEPFEGKVAVAQVTLNRVASGNFAKTICGVVYQKNIVYEKVLCQFSWYCESGKAALKPAQSVAWKESQEVAKQVLLENFRLPSMKNALFYHADYINPQWGKPVVGRIGRHIFYSEKT